jgi:hypothetical protein
MKTISRIRNYLRKKYFSLDGREEITEALGIDKRFFWYRLEKMNLPIYTKENGAIAADPKAVKRWLQNPANRKYIEELKSEAEDFVYRQGTPIYTLKGAAQNTKKEVLSRKGWFKSWKQKRRW